LRQGEKRFRTVLESSTVPFNILEPVRIGVSDLRWIYMNVAAARCSGMPSIAKTQT